MPDLIEEWRPVIGGRGVYEVSSLGRVRSLDRITICKGVKNKVHNRKYRGRYLTWVGHPETAYAAVGILLENGRTQKEVHLMVAEAFIGPVPRGCVANHKDLDKWNNRSSNLEYITQGENVQHAIQAGRVRSKIKPAQVFEIKRLLSRGFSRVVIAEEYGIGEPSVRNIETGNTWKSLKEIVCTQ